MLSENCDRRLEYVDNMQQASTSFRPISVDGHPQQHLFVHIGKSEATVTNNKKTNNALEAEP